ncbi:tyrosine-type recombinase/integrase [Secundilactobacillus mixtipabuli]|uniref:Integrase n=1 Tax=Secundilactobacillus mixtipabuli TaxID=1435342 RepID=A0A1Z5IDF8_9LACO|nr:site-specific integrase [Secundilactobacillus mixtipabuli]GAW99697.1 integrase [Secundilactobacillus mixtipabuli]
MVIKRTAMKHHPNIYEYETKRGKRYSVRRRYKDFAGKYEMYTSSGYTSWQDAEQDLRKFEMKFFDGSLSESEQRKITVDDYFDTVRKRKVEAGVWKHSTEKQRVNVYEHIISPVFGKRSLNDISRMEYQQFITNLGNSQKYTVTTLRHINSVMQSIMADAETYNIIPKSLIRRIQLVGGRPKKSQTVTKEEYDQFMRTAKKICNQYDFAMVKLLTLGERRGELMGLRKSSFTFTNDDVTNEPICAIKFDLARTPDAVNGTTLKSAASYRTIWVTGSYIDTIKFVLSHAEQIIRNFKGTVPDDYFIWINPVTGKPFQPERSRDLFARISMTAGVKINPHKFRHYFATKVRSNARISDTDAMHWLGHKHIEMTDSYTRETPEGAIQVFRGIEDDLRPITPTHK